MEDQYLLTYDIICDFCNDAISSKRLPTEAEVRNLVGWSKVDVDWIRSHMKTIDEKTDDLLELADIFEEHNVNVEHNGRMVNPVGFIRNKVDIIFEELAAIRLDLR